MPEVQNPQKPQETKPETIRTPSSTSPPQDPPPQIQETGNPETPIAVTQDGEREEMTWEEFRKWYNRQEETSAKVDRMYEQMFPETPPQNPQDKGKSTSPQESEKPKSKIQQFWSEVKHGPKPQDLDP